MAARWRVELAPTGYRSMEEIGDKGVRREIARTIDGLDQNPERQGKALVQPLEGLRSVRTARDRFRVLYRLDADSRVVSVLLVARRKAGREDDVYVLARRLLLSLGG